jgi:hypothetical protein
MNEKVRYCPDCGGELGFQGGHKSWCRWNHPRLTCEAPALLQEVTRFTGHLSPHPTTLVLSRPFKSLGWSGEFSEVLR